MQGNLETSVGFTGWDTFTPDSLPQGTEEKASNPESHTEDEEVVEMVILCQRKQKQLMTDSEP